LEDWNATGANYPSDLTAHQLIEAQARRQPNATAVVMPQVGDQPRTTLTYEVLNARANQLAHYLRKLGVGPESRVGICMERSPELITAVLGVLKAGGAYVPLDPQHPQERLAYMLEDAAVTVLVTHTAQLDNLAAYEGRTVCVNRDGETIARESMENPPNVTRPKNLAYVIYTSGSTGQSKGTQVEHRNLVNAYFAWRETYTLDEVRAHLQMANVAFDVFSGDYVRALGSGGKLVLCPREWLLMPERLYALLQQEQVTFAEFVPVVLRHLVQYLEETDQRLDFVRVLPCGSDSWYVREYQRFSARCGPATRLINSFGLTEATVDSTYFEGPIGDLSREQMAPLRQHAALRARPTPAAAARGRAGGVVRWRRRRGARVPPAPGSDRRAVRA
jgi:non-ribosomal peptide synthetase component F